MSVAELGKSCGFSVATSAHNYPADNPVAPTYAKLSDIPLAHSHRYIVIATQGTADLDTIKTALDLDTRHLAFVGSRKKISHLQDKLHSEGYKESDRKKLTGPAGLDIGGVTPQEIALSILAEIVQIRRADRATSPIRPST